MKSDVYIIHVSQKAFSDLSCPSCSKTLKVRLLVCDDCGVKVEGTFQPNEFATLPPEDLHFLRVFVQSEGRIREMETALGLSYPTIRTRLSALRAKLGPAAGVSEENDDREAKIRAILDSLSKGKLPFEKALSQIQELKRSP